MALRYPENTDNYKYGGTISFTAFEEEVLDVSLSDVSSFFNSNVPHVSEVVPPGRENEFVRSVVNVAASEDIGAQATKTLNAPETKSALLGNGFRPPIRTDKTDARIKTKTETTTLYLPPGLVFGDGVQYDNFDLGTIGAGALQALNQGQSIAGSIGGTLVNEIKSFGDFLLNSPDVTDLGARALLARASKFVPGQLAEGLVQSATGVTVNPNKRSLMKGPNIRTFSFTFTLIPSSESEARTIRNIIKFFRSEVYPEEIRYEGVPIGYKIPKKFDIRIKYNDKEIATKILPCFLQSIQTTYNPDSMSFHRDGEFSQTQMTLSFVEERTLSRQDIVGAVYERSADQGVNPELKGLDLQQKYEGGY